VHQYLDRQGHSFFKGVFEKFADIEISMGTAGDTAFDHSYMDYSSMSVSKSKVKALIRTDGLKDALLELGVQMKREKVEALMAVMDLDENGGLDFDEFKRAVQQPLTQLEQWASMLPLAGVLARSLPVSGGQGDQSLRDFSRLGEDEINAAVVVVFSEGLRCLLMEANASESARQMFDSVNKKVEEAGRASGVSAVK
jgi:hypothetical protein